MIDERKSVRVHISPWYGKPDKGDGGIRRVVEAQKKYLPQFGVEPVENPDLADIIACHALDLVVRPGVPMVAHNHGLYWSGFEWARALLEGNRRVVKMLTHAVAHTAPSRWVSTALRRGMLIYPEVIPHGVDASDWNPKPGGPGNFVLWNKARTDQVSDPSHMDRLAALCPEIPFVSTFGQKTDNVTLIGKIPFPDMKQVIESAGVFLVTPRETFGIGTLEAMSAGVPIVGWKWGGQVDIVRQNETGILVPPGDYQALAEALRNVYENRVEMGENAREDALSRWTWPDKIEKYAALYKRTAREYQQERPRVSVLVTCYNLAHYLDECLESVLSQSFADWECLIVDDCSTDRTAEVANEWVLRDPRFKYFRTPENLKLSGAKNYAFEKSTGELVIYLDADDLFADRALERLVAGMDVSQGVHIVFGHLDLISEDGTGRRRNAWPFPDFDWYGQISHYNQLPYSALMRRQVMENSGGFRRRAWRAEDAEFWTRVSSLGYRVRKVTQESTIIYRVRGDSKSKGETGDGDWTAWFPWRLGDARSDKKIRTIAKSKSHPEPWTVPFGAQGRQPKNKTFWDVRDQANPVISVIIPVGPGHESVLIDALDSLVAQRFQEWEAIVVNDTGRSWDPGFSSPIAGAPFAQVLETNGQVGTGAARNLGVRAARGRGLLFLDADDILLPHYLESMVPVFLSTGGLVYSDWYKNLGDPQTPMEIFQAIDFSCNQILNKMGHLMTSIVPTWSHKKIGGFAENIPGWEDWDYLIRLHGELGLCGYRVPEPLVVYRFTKGSRRSKSAEIHKPELIEHLRTRFRKFYKREVDMGCRKCPNGRASRKSFAIRKSFRGSVVAGSQNGGNREMKKYTYNHPDQGKRKYRGKATGIKYAFKPGKPFVFIYEEDYLHPNGFQTHRVQGQPVFLPYEEEQVPVAEAEVPDVQPEIEAELPTVAPPTEVEIVDPGTLTVAALKKHLIGLTEAELRVTLAAERSGKDRQSAVKAIETELGRVNVPA